MSGLRPTEKLSVSPTTPNWTRSLFLRTTITLSRAEMLRASRDEVCPFDQDSLQAAGQPLNFRKHRVNFGRSPGAVFLRVWKARRYDCSAGERWWSNGQGKNPAC